MNLKQTISIFCLLIGMNNYLSGMQVSLAQVQALEGGIDVLNQKLHRLEQTSANLPETESSSIPNDEEAQAEEEAAKAAEFFKKQKAKEQQDKLEAAMADAAQSKKKVQSLTTKLYGAVGSMGTIILGLSGWLLHATSTVNMGQLAVNMNQLVVQHLAVLEELGQRQLLNQYQIFYGQLIHNEIHRATSTGVMAIIEKLFIR